MKTFDWKKNHHENCSVILRWLTSLDKCSHCFTRQKGGSNHNSHKKSYRIVNGQLLIRHN